MQKRAEICVGRTLNVGEPVVVDTGNLRFGQAVNVVE